MTLIKNKTMEEPKGININGITWYSAEEIALLLDKTPETIRLWVKSGKIIKKRVRGFKSYRPTKDIVVVKAYKV